MPGDTLLFIILATAIFAMLGALAVLMELPGRLRRRRARRPQYQWKPVRRAGIVYGDREPDMWEIIQRRNHA